MVDGAQSTKNASAGTDPLLQPFKLRHLTLRNRIISTAHACGLEEGGLPLERYQRYHEEKARGGLALTMFGGSSNVAPDSPSVFQQLNVGTDAIIPHLRQFSERIHNAGAAIMVQITHLGRRGEPYVQDWLPTIAPSPVRETLHRSIPREMDQYDIDRVVTAFGQAALRCKEGGLDGIETLSGAHLIGQFLSPVTNQRTDQFGGSLDNRCRFGLMVHEEIRRQAGDDFLCGFRFVIDEAINDGLSFDDCVEIAGKFERSGTIDFFNAVYGRMDTEITLAMHNMPGMAAPLGPWLEKAGAFRREVKLPVFHAARITDLATARHAIREGLLDMVGMTRAHIADPYLVSKLESGNETQIRPCVGASYCMGTTRPTCIHNATTGRETVLPQIIPPSAGSAKKIVVVGGGPAGMEAARVSAERGHNVVLLEAAGSLGGQVLLAASQDWRRDLIGIVSWRESELERLGVDVRLNVLAESGDVLAETPDAVIIATGGIPDNSLIEGGELCMSVWDAIAEPPPAAGQTVIFDGTGRQAALMAATRYAKSGLHPTLITIDDRTGADLVYAERVVWRKRLYECGVLPVTDQKLIKVARSGNRLVANFINEVTDEITQYDADRVIVENGTIAVDGLFHDLRDAAGNAGVTDIDALIALRSQPSSQNPDAPYQLHRIGDAVASRNIAAAIYDALRLCVVM